MVTFNTEAVDTIEERLAQALAVLATLRHASDDKEVDFTVSYGVVCSTIWAVEALLEQAQAAAATVRRPMLKAA